MAIAKLLLFFLQVVALQYGTTPPHGPPPTEQLREQRGAERSVSLYTAVGNMLLWSWAFLEGSVLFALSGYCPPALARPLLEFFLPATLTSSDPTSLTALTPTFLVGSFLILAGGLLRARCYHALGSRFTFELCIRPAHALVTDGVYGVVRHPGYTGGFGLVIGWLLCVLDQRGCVVSVLTGLDPNQASAPGGVGSGPAVVTGVVWVTALGLLCVAISKRMDKEDAMLEKNFGEEWRAWAKKVPCRLVPGVY